MKVVLLCGGQGTRIRDVADDIPKSMIPIGEFPIIWHIINHYARFGHKEFILCLGYKGNVLKEFFLNYDAFTHDFTLTMGRDKSVEFHGSHDGDGWKVTLANTGLAAMTGARIRRIRRYVGKDDNFLLTYGDGVSDVDLDSLVKFHKAHGRILTVTGVRPPGRFGEIEFEADGRVTEFNEKPQAAGGWISGGFFVCRRELFDYLDDEENLVFEEGPMRALVEAGELRVYGHSGFWQCMDTFRDWKLLNGIWETGKALWGKQ